MAIQVTIEDPSGNTSRAAKLVENAPIARLLPAVISALGLPILDSAGRPMQYHLSYGKHQLLEDETLEAAGVAQGDTLTIGWMIPAGGAYTDPQTNLYDGKRNVQPLSRKAEYLSIPRDIVTTPREVLDEPLRATSLPQGSEPTINEGFSTSIADHAQHHLQQLSDYYESPYQIISIYQDYLIVLPKLPGSSEKSDDRIQALWGRPVPTPAIRPKGRALVKPVVSIFGVQMDSTGHLSIRVEGGLSYESPDAPLWRGQSIQDLNRMMHEMSRDIVNAERNGDPNGRAAWRGKAKREGGLLRDKLYESLTDFQSQLLWARHAVRKPENLTLLFSGPRSHLGMPYELLYLDGKPLVTLHPVCRYVKGPAIQGRHFEGFVRELKRQRKPLRVLLISADTGGLASDQEIAEIKQRINEMAQGLVEVAITAVPTARSGFAEVERLLKRCPYHIVHIASHGAFDEKTGENSGLLFWKDAAKRTEQVVLTARQLHEWLSSSDTRLVYLSASLGACVGEESLLLNHDYLGVIDAVVQAGVPYCLGYRWPIANGGRRAFASLFYERLFSRPFAFVPERAVFHARKERYAAAATDDETWMSPILVTQIPYR